MDVLAWLWWLLTGLLGLVWSLVWFLLGGWVSTLAQIGVIVLVVFGYKYGWRRAPQEVMARLASLGRFAWAWLRSAEPGAAAPRAGERRDGRPARDQRRREPGDVQINLSTMLSLLMIVGLWALTAIPR